MAAVAAPPLPRIKGGAFLVEDRTAGEIFTPEDFTEEHLQIAKTANDFVTEEVVPHAEHLEHKDYEMMRSLLRKAGELGLLSMDIPEEYGGLELDKVSSVLVSEYVAKYASYSGAHGAHSSIGTHPINWFGTPEQKAKYLPKVATAEMVAAYCLSEAHAGSDALAARTRADLSADGTHYILNGEKMWITNGGFADLYIVFAKVNGDKFTAFIVERTFPGIKPGAEEKKMGIHGSSTTPVILSDCKVPVENVLGEVGRGHIIAFNVLNMGRLKLAAGAVGGMKQTIKHSLAYAQERTTFGKPISHYGLIQHKLAQMAILTYASEGILYRTAGMIDTEFQSGDHSVDASRKAIEEYAVECAINKVFASEALGYCADEAVQIYGGYGFHADYPPERVYRDARINRIFEGTNEINRLLVVDMLMKRALKGELPLMAAGKKLQDEIMEGPSGSSDPVANMKKIFLFTADAAMKKYMTNLKDQQEVIGAMTNIVFEVFASETARLRARKLGNSAQAADMTDVYIYEAMGRVEAEARAVLAHCCEGDDLRTRLAILKRFTKQEAVDTIEGRRRICARLLERGKYSV
jgi:butyryl-CoA dehydrogenase